MDPAALALRARRQHRRRRRPARLRHPPHRSAAARPPRPTPPASCPTCARHLPLARASPTTGPVYEKTATGQVVPYVAPPGRPGATSASLTGGSAGRQPPDEPPSPSCSCPGTTGPLRRRPRRRADVRPAGVQEIVWAGNQIIGLPYIYGGGHASFTSPGYDCSGTVSFALHGASLLTTPEDSSEFEGFGSHGIGRWVTIFANPGHAYMTVAGLRLDTSSADDPSNQQGPRWRPLRPANPGFIVRHPARALGLAASARLAASAGTLTGRPSETQ